MTGLLTLMALLAPLAWRGGHVRPARTATCAESPLLAELHSASGKALLRLYGYDLQEVWVCTPIRSALAPTAQTLHFGRVSTHDDEYTAFTVLKAADVQAIWVVPTNSGMLRVPGAECDRHNMAAFNAVLRSMPRRPSKPAEWEALARLYLAVVGRPEVFSLVAAEANSTTCGAQGECELSFADRAPDPSGGYWRFTVSFEAGLHDAPRLSDVTAELVPAAE